MWFLWCIIRYACLHNHFIALQTAHCFKSNPKWAIVWSRVWLSKNLNIYLSYFFNLLNIFYLIQIKFQCFLYLIYRCVICISDGLGTRNLIFGYIPGKLKKEFNASWTRIFSIFSQIFAIFEVLQCLLHASLCKIIK